MESPTHSLVDASLGTLTVILSVLDFSTIKNEVFPVIAAVFTKTSSLGIKIRGLEALQVLCGGAPGQDGPTGDGLDGLDQSDKNKKKPQSAILDKYTIQEKVVPLLKGIKTKEPAVMVSGCTLMVDTLLTIPRWPLLMSSKKSAKLRMQTSSPWTLCQFFGPSV